MVEIKEHKRGVARPELRFTIQSGILTIQLNEEEAKEVCKKLCDSFGLEPVDKEKVKLLALKANINSTKKRPLGV